MPQFITEGAGDTPSTLPAGAEAFARWLAKSPGDRDRWPASLSPFDLEEIAALTTRFLHPVVGTFSAARALSAVLLHLQERERHFDQRVTELLVANNRDLDRRRAAEQRAEHLLAILRLGAAWGVNGRHYDSTIANGLRDWIGAGASGPLPAHVQDTVWLLAPEMMEQLAAGADTGASNDGSQP